MESQQPAVMPWPRACALALGWTGGGVAAAAVIAGLLNGLNLVNGQDMVVGLWVAVLTVPVVLALSQAVHRTPRVAMMTLLFLIPAGLFGFFGWFVASYGQWAK